jgi:hypothetical protein
MTGDPNRNRHRGFIVLFGWRTVASRDGSDPIRARCPACQTDDVELVGMIRRQWFTLFFIPVIPIESAQRGQRVTKCKHCKQMFDIPLEQLARRSGDGSYGAGATFADAIAIYNQLREKPDDGNLMLRLLETYAAMNEPAEAEASARHFPKAFAANPQCAQVLARMRDRPG